jgi:uncharacterized integral membrane protein
MNTKIVIFIILILLAVILMFQNRAPVAIQLLFWAVTIPRIILIVIFLLIGFATGYIAATMNSQKSSSS